MEALLIVILIAALIGLPFVWAEWRVKISNGTLPVWRKLLATCGAATLTGQGLVFVLLIPMSGGGRAFQVLIFAAPVLFIFSVILLSFGIGQFRWGSILCSGAFVLLSFFLVLAITAG